MLVTHQLSLVLPQCDLVLYIDKVMQRSSSSDGDSIDIAKTSYLLTSGSAAGAKTSKVLWSGNIQEHADSEACSTSGVIACCNPQVFVKFAQTLTARQEGCSGDSMTFLDHIIASIDSSQSGVVTKSKETELQIRECITIFALL